MTISSKTRKNLWAKSGNRCAICKIELFAERKTIESLNIGEECHIISSKKNGPRYKQGLLDYDTYDNLLLLCRNHHKEIDTLTESYDEELLRYMKTNHEMWVRTTLDDSVNKDKESRAKFLYRITSGKELFNIISGVDGYRIDYDEADNKEESDYIAGILQTLTDYADLTSMGIDINKVEIGFELRTILQDLESKDYLLFAERNIEDINENGTVMKNWSIATLMLTKKDSDNIVRL